MRVEATLAAVAVLRENPTEGVVGLVGRGQARPNALAVGDDRLLVALPKCGQVVYRCIGRGVEPDLAVRLDRQVLVLLDLVAQSLELLLRRFENVKRVVEQQMYVRGLFEAASICRFTLPSLVRAALAASPSQS